MNFIRETGASSQVEFPSEANDRLWFCIFKSLGYLSATTVHHYEQGVVKQTPGHS